MRTTSTRAAGAALGVAALGLTSLATATAMGAAAPAAVPAQVAPVTVSSPLQDGYVPVQPCRIVDTRKAGGRLAAGATRSFVVRGTSGFTAQGGTSAGCGIPESATSITTNVTITKATGNGYTSGYPAGTPEPYTNFVTFYGDRDITANPTLPLGRASLASDVSMTGHGHAAFVIVDVTGYYVPFAAGAVATDGGLLFSSGPLQTSALTAPGTYLLTFDRDVSQCAVSATPTTSGVRTDGVTLLGNTAVVRLEDLTGTPTNGSFNVGLAC